MPKRSKTAAKTNDDSIILVENPMKAKHAKPDPDTAHGLCLANPCRVLVIGGCGEDDNCAQQHCTGSHVEAMGWRNLLDGTNQRRTAGRVWAI